MLSPRCKLRHHLHLPTIEPADCKHHVDYLLGIATKREELLLSEYITAVFSRTIANVHLTGFMVQCNSFTTHLYTDLRTSCFFSRLVPLSPWFWFKSYKYLPSSSSAQSVGLMCFHLSSDWWCITKHGVTYPPLSTPEKR